MSPNQDINNNYIEFFTVRPSWLDADAGKPYATNGLRRRMQSTSSGCHRTLRDMDSGRSRSLTHFPTSLQCDKIEAQHAEPRPCSSGRVASNIGGILMCVHVTVCGYVFWKSSLQFLVKVFTHKKCVTKAACDIYNYYAVYCKSQLSISMIAVTSYITALLYNGMFKQMCYIQ